MGRTARVTMTLPDEIVEEIDRCERNRSRFLLEAVRRELTRRRREGLRRSLQNPHSESSSLPEEDFEQWADSLPDEEAPLLDAKAGRPVRWVPEQGWVEADE